VIVIAEALTDVITPRSGGSATFWATVWARANPGSSSKIPNKNLFMAASPGAGCALCLNAARVR
jgi:hypothetical protein